MRNKNGRTYGVKTVQTWGFSITHDDLKYVREVLENHGTGISMFIRNCIAKAREDVLFREEMCKLPPRLKRNKKGLWREPEDD